MADFDDLGGGMGGDMGGTWGPGDEGLMQGGGYDGYDGTYDEEELRQGYQM